MPLKQSEDLVSADQPGVSPELGEVGAAVLDLIAEYVPPDSTFSAGARLDHGLAMDQRLREARTRAMQRRLHAAYRTETHARSVCVGAGLGSLVLWLIVLIPVWESDRNPPLIPGDLLRTLVVIVGLLVAISLPIAAVTAVMAARWRRHLLRIAAEQHLEVHDPGHVDYR